MQSSKETAKLISEHWCRTILNRITISMTDIISIITLFCYRDPKILQWSTIFKSPNGYLKLIDDRKCVQRNDTERYLYEWIMPDIDPVLNGIHCWRVHVSNPAQSWILFSVSPKKMYASDHYCGPSTHEDVWGIGKYPGNIYPKKNNKDKKHNDGNRSIFYSIIKPFDVDILLDVDHGELHICLVGKKEHEFKLWNMPLNTKHGWIPHISTEGCSEMTMLRLAVIDIDLYGESALDLFNDDKS
eukprot:222576_1